MPYIPSSHIFAAAELEGEQSAAAPAGADLADEDSSALQDIDFDDGVYMRPSVLMSLMSHFQRITPIFIGMHGTTRRLLSPLLSVGLWTSTRRPLWSARRTKL